MSYVVCLPYVYQPYYDACRATMRFPGENVLAIDNTVNNVGIMKAHNMGVAEMRERQADWLIIMSAAIRFGKNGGLDFLDILDDHQTYHVIHGASANVQGGMQSNPNGGGGVNKVFGWHFVAFNRKVFDRIGVWDENFTPYGLDDIDMSLRIRKGFGEETLWDTYPCDVFDTTMSHSINLANVKSSYPPRDNYFFRKWGRRGDEWQDNGFATPFNDPEAGLDYWPQPEDPRSIHQVEFKTMGWNYGD